VQGVQCTSPWAGEQFAQNSRPHSINHSSAISHFRTEGSDAFDTAFGGITMRGPCVWLALRRASLSGRTMRSAIIGLIAALLATRAVDAAPAPDSVLETKAKGNHVNLAGFEPIAGSGP
jgi:hypothetical protein